MPCETFRLERCFTPALGRSDREEREAGRKGGEREGRGKGREGRGLSDSADQVSKGPCLAFSESSRSNAMFFTAVVQLFHLQLPWLCKDEGRRRLVW